MTTTLDLKSLQHNVLTNLKKNRINNRDAVVLLLGQHNGIAHRKVLRKALLDWRPGLHHSYLFNSYYNQVANNFAEASRRVYHEGHITWDESGEMYTRKGHDSDRRMYWYRLDNGIYGLTAEGYRRLGELTTQAATK